MKQSFNTDRRHFIKRASLSSLVAMTSPAAVFAAYSTGKTQKISLKEGDTILFQGDSITDAGRNRNSKEANSQSMLGNGYALLAAAALLQRFPEKNLKIYNKGISGNKVYQLAERWEADCLDLKPNVLSILIGVNDFWHTLDGRYKGTAATYRTDFANLIDQTKQKLPNVQLIIGQPFAVSGVKAVDEKWFPAFDEYRVAASEIAGRYGAIFIPYQTIFDKAQKKAPGVYWTGDGVHPSVAGNQLMAAAWLDTVKG